MIGPDIRNRFLFSSYKKQMYLKLLLWLWCNMLSAKKVTLVSKVIEVI